MTGTPSIRTSWISHCGASLLVEQYADQDGTTYSIREIRLRDDQPGMDLEEVAAALGCCNDSARNACVAAFADGAEEVEPWP